MRLIVTGHTPEGQSTVISDGTPSLLLKYDKGDMLSIIPKQIHSEPATIVEGESVTAILWSTQDAPPTISGPKHAPPTIESLDLPPGRSRLAMLRMGAGAFASPHRTHTLDYDVIVAGGGELILDTGAVQVNPGDCIILPGVRHAWRAGPHGIIFTAAMIGLAP